MLDPQVAVHEGPALQESANQINPDSRLAELLNGVAATEGSPVLVSVPAYTTRVDQHAWKNLLVDPAESLKRKVFLHQLRALLKLNELATSEKISLGEAASRLEASYGACLEKAWVSILSENRRKEQGVRWAALFFRNLQESASKCEGKVFVMNATAEEIASTEGCAILAGELSKYYHRPDPRQSRGYIVVQGWVGSKPALDRLAKTACKHRALLVTDAPPYDSQTTLTAASQAGGLLESLPGEEIYHRYTVLIGNAGRARARFVGRAATEKEDIYVPLSSSFFGQHLNNMMQGKYSRPAVGYQSPLLGIDGVQVDLYLQNEAGYSLYARHRINPAILLANESSNVVIWGPDALYKAGNGLQIGVADTELRIIRYTEWIVNQYGLLNETEEAERKVRHKLANFVSANSGADRMFRMGSRVDVKVDEDSKKLNIDFVLHYRQLVERAAIFMKKPVKRTENADFDVKMTKDNNN